MPHDAPHVTIPNLGVFEECSHSQKLHIQNVVRLRIYKNGETIIKKGEPSPFVGLILSGVVIVMRERTEGSDAVMAFHLPTDIIGVPDQTPSMFDIVASGTVKIAYWTVEDFTEIIQMAPSVILRAISRALDRLELVQDWIVKANQLDARMRLISLIALMAHRHVQAGLSSPEEPVNLKLPASRDQIGSLLGLGLYTVSRQMGDLKDEGLIEFDGPHLIVVPNPRKLWDLCSCNGLDTEDDLARGFVGPV